MNEQQPPRSTRGRVLKARINRNAVRIGLAAVAASLVLAGPAAAHKSDPWITMATKVRLMANDATPALRINVDTNDGEVILFGSVPTDASRQAAEAEARKVDGVVSVKSELQIVANQVKDDVEAQDSELADAISKKIHDARRKRHSWHALGPQLLLEAHASGRRRQASTGTAGPSSSRSTSTSS